MAEAVGFPEHGAGGAGGVVVAQVACQVAEGQGSQVFKICHYTPLSVRYFGHILCYHGMHREGLVSRKPVYPGQRKDVDFG